MNEITKINCFLFEKKIKLSFAKLQVMLTDTSNNKFQLLQIHVSTNITDKSALRYHNVLFYFLHSLPWKDQSIFISKYTTVLDMKSHISVLYTQLFIQLLTTSSYYLYSVNIFALTVKGIEDCRFEHNCSL